MASSVWMPGVRRARRRRAGRTSLSASNSAGVLAGSGGDEHCRHPGAPRWRPARKLRSRSPVPSEVAMNAVFMRPMNSRMGGITQPENCGSQDRPARPVVPHCSCCTCSAAEPGLLAPNITASLQRRHRLRQPDDLGVGPIAITGHFSR